MSTATASTDIEVFFTLLPPICTGQIGEGQTGIIDGKVNGHVPAVTASLNGHLNGGENGHVADTVGGQSKRIRRRRCSYASSGRT